MTKAEEVIEALREPLCICGHAKKEHIQYETVAGDLLDVWCNECLGVRPVCDGFYQAAA